MQPWLTRINQLIVHGTHTPPAQVGEGAVCHCLNCGTDFSGNYCPNCGQSRKTKRLTFAQALDNLLGAAVDMERGLLHTLVELFYRPGYMMRDYLRGHRVEYVKPIQLLFLLSTLYLVAKYVLFYGWDMQDEFTFNLEDKEQQARWQSQCRPLLRLHGLVVPSVLPALLAQNYLACSPQLVLRSPPIDSCHCRHLSPQRRLDCPLRY